MRLRLGDPEEVGMSAERLRRASHLAEGWVAQGIHPALVVHVARRGRVVLHEAFGKLGPEPDAPPLPLDAIFPIASITKTITATAAMILVEDGLLGLNRPVVEYIPEFVGPGKDQVMVHHLLTHTSGLRDEDFEAHVLDKVRSATPELTPDETDPLADGWPAVEYFSHTHDAPLWKPPGSEMSYCSHGYVLLGEIVRRVSGSRLGDFVHERIFAPLEMASSYFHLPEDERSRYVRRSPTAVGADFLNAWGVESLASRLEVGASGVMSTASDLTRFGHTFLLGDHGQPRILSAASVAEMTRDQIPGIPASWGKEAFPEAGWGLGLHLQLPNKRALYWPSLTSWRSFGHGGMGGSMLWIDPDNELVIAFLSVTPENIWESQEKWCADLFVNVVVAAVVD